MQILRDQHCLKDDSLHLLSGRVHEAEGRGRAVFALFQAVRLPGPIIWVVLAHDRDRPMTGTLPRGVAERLHLIEARSETDLLWAVEESLRARPVGLVIAAPEKPISLTAGRRLQLAAEAGGTTGLLLIREGGEATPPRLVGNVNRCLDQRTRLVIVGPLIRTKREHLDSMM